MYLSQGQSTSEPKEIGGSSVLCGNPNLIKPIPVKPNTQVKHPHLLPITLQGCIQYIVFFLDEPLSDRICDVLEENLSGPQQENRGKGLAKV